MVYLFVVIQIYNKFSGFLLFFTIIYNLSLEMSDEPKKYVVRIVCVIMLLLVQFDVCAPLIDANLAMVETMEQPTLPSDNNEESRGEETYYFQSGRAQLPNSRFLPCTIDMLVNLFAIPQVPVQSYTPVSENPGKVVHHHIIFCVYRI